MSASQRTGSRLIARDVLEHFRRERIFLAVAKLAQERGASALTTAAIIKQGRMSRNTFYDLFADKAECLDLACEFAGERLVGPIREAETEDRQGERLGDAISALLEAVSTEPAVAELCVVHAPSISEHGREVGLEAIVEALIEAMGSDGDAADREVSPGLREFVAATITSIVISRVRRGEAAGVGELQDDLTALAARLWNEPAEQVGAP